MNRKAVVAKLVTFLTRSPKLKGCATSKEFSDIVLAEFPNATREESWEAGFTVHMLLREMIALDDAEAQKCFENAQGSTRNDLPHAPQEPAQGV